MYGLISLCKSGLVSATSLLECCICMATSLCVTSMSVPVLYLCPFVSGIYVLTNEHTLFDSLVIDFDELMSH